MLDAIRLYTKYVGASFRSQMQYRASFVMQSVGQFAINGIEFLAVWALFHRFGSLGGWSLPEVALLYGLVHSAWALTDATSAGFDHFGDLVKSGDFDRILLRPRSTVLQLAAQELTLRRIGRFLQGFVVLVWAISVLQVDWSLAKAALLVASVLACSCFFYGLLIFQATLSFWTTETLEVMNVFTYGGVDTARYPMGIYGRRFRQLFTFVIPLACVTYFPTVVILGRPETLGLPARFGWYSPLMGLLFLGISLQVWRLGVRHYQSTGS